jgi:hypothetical protein
MCAREWPTCKAFLRNDQIRLGRFQENREKAGSAKKVAGLLIYTHTPANCGTTLAIPAQQLSINALPLIG